MTLFTVGIGDCQLTIDHDDLLVFFEELEVTVLKFYDDVGKRSAFFPVIAVGLVLLETFLEGNYGYKRLGDLLAFEFDFCL